MEPAHAPPNLINGLVALHDVTLAMGPTEFVPGSHRETNHHSNNRVQGETVVYQNARPATHCRTPTQ